MRIIKKYKAKEGATFGNKKAQIYGEALNKIAEKTNQTLKPKDVVEEARNPRNPLHEAFDWDNSSAAAKYRLEQARNLIRSVLVEVSYDHTSREQNAYINVNERPDDIRNVNRSYVSIVRVLTEKPLREQMLLTAIRELEYWQEKYNECRELNIIFSAIKSVKKRLKLKKRRK